MFVAARVRVLKTLCGALAATYMIACGGTSTQTGPQTGSVSGTVSSSAGGGLAGVQVQATPSGSAALAAVATNATGTYTISNVPVGSGSVTVSGIPTGCTPPASTAYTVSSSGATGTANVVVTCPPPVGTVTGVVTDVTTNTPIAAATVTITPTSGNPLVTTTNSSGVYSLASVPAGGGSVTLSNLPTACAAPGAGSYASLTSGRTATVNFSVACPTTTSLAVGQAAVFTTSPFFNTNLVLQPNAQYLITIVNTDAASSQEDFVIAGATASGSRVVPRPHDVSAQRTKAPTRPRLAVRGPSDARSVAGGDEVARLLRMTRTANALHEKQLEAGVRKARALGDPRPALRTYAALRAAGNAPRYRAAGLAGTTVGAVNAINVPNFTASSCSSVTPIGVRTVYVGQHVQIVADTSLTNWPSAYRPDSAYYTALGQEYDTLTYAKHLLTYIGDPLEFDSQLSSVGKVTVVFTPVLNNIPGFPSGAFIVAFVDPCDFYAPSQNPQSNFTETVYMTVPGATEYPVNIWERAMRPTLAHESKHIVSLGEHIFNGGGNFEESWLEEGLAQVSSEIWGRNYNQATWRGNAGYTQTVYCEFLNAPCNTATTPFTFLFGHFPFLYDYIRDLDSATVQVPEALANTVEGKYGAGWSLARWSIDNYAPGSGAAAEGAYIKQLIQDYSATGVANVSRTTSASAGDLLVWWSLATAYDQSTLTDSTTFHPADARATLPSFDFRNIYSSLYSADPGTFPVVAPLKTYQAAPGTFAYILTGIPGTESVYFLLQVGSSGSTQSLQLLNSSEGPLSSGSGLRVGIIRVQ